MATLPTVTVWSQGLSNATAISHAQIAAGISECDWDSGIINFAFNQVTQSISDLSECLLGLFPEDSPPSVSILQPSEAGGVEWVSLQSFFSEGNDACAAVLSCVASAPAATQEELDALTGEAQLFVKSPTTGSLVCVTASDLFGSSSASFNNVGCISPTDMPISGGGTSTLTFTVPTGVTATYSWGGITYTATGGTPVTLTLVANPGVGNGANLSQVGGTPYSGPPLVPVIAVENGQNEACAQATAEDTWDNGSDSNAQTQSVVVFRLDS